MATSSHKGSLERSAIEERYNSAAWNTQGLLRDFLSKWHGKALTLEAFEAQEVDIEIEDRTYEELPLHGQKDRLGRSITPFNSDFFGLFKDLLLAPKAEEDLEYTPKNDLLWCGILEVEKLDGWATEAEIPEAEKAADKEKINYSLFCFSGNHIHPGDFFVAHRKYEQMQDDLVSLTNFFLHEDSMPDLYAGNRFKPWFIKVRPHPHVIPRGQTDRFYPPDHSSYGFLFDEDIIARVDEKLAEFDLHRLVNDVQKDSFLDAIRQTYESLVDGIPHRLALVPAGSTGGEVVSDRRFAYYILWLRAVGIAGGAKRNWVDYYYFRVPDLSGYLHAVTIASTAPLDPGLFHLIDRNAPSLFQRSLLRLAVKEKELRKDVQSHARRAAVVAVMARNMSHNVGSHVLARLSTPEQLSTKDAGTTSDSETLSQLATLNSYLQTRMDFLADLATSIPVVALPKRLYRDVCVYFRPVSSEDRRVDWQRLLMDRISGSTNIKRDKIKAKIKLLKEDSEQRIGLNTADIDPIFASPNDMLGAHALYVIFENIIRNCAKHSQISPKSKLELSVLVDEFNHDYWRLTILDNLGECKRNEDLVTDLRAKIDRSILETDGSLRRGGWGMLEMKIAAAYLRRISPSHIDDEHEPPLLTPIPKDGNLGFELYLRRPKVALIVDSIGNDFLPLQGDLKPFGIDVFRTFEEPLTTSAEHDFLILAETERSHEALIEASEALPARVLFISDGRLADGDDLPGEEFLRQLKSKDIEAIREYIWSKRVPLNVLPTIKKGHCSPGSRARVDVLLAGADGDNTCIFFDNHGLCFSLVRPDDILYYEPYESKSPTGLILNYLPSPGPRRNTILYELIEAANLRVAIVDERVQSESQKACIDYPGIKKRKIADILRWMKIFVPEPSVVDLNKQQLASQDCEALVRQLNDFSKTCDFLVIHLGVIERLIGSTDEVKISEWVANCKSKFRGFVITSGRGRPSNLPGDARFLHYSLISRYVFDERSKYHLCKVLYASRRIPK